MKFAIVVIFYNYICNSKSKMNLSPIQLCFNHI